ncbi:MAG: prepilin-type N-terminal cleavage/methylation domain-containing protein [Pseudomonadota bacterium]
MTRSAARGFTLTEMLVTLALLGLLASVIVPLAQVGIQRNQERELKLALRQIRAALDAYKQAVDEGHVASPADASGYPPSLEVLVEGVPDAKDPARRTLYFLRRVPRDPMNRDETIPAAATWGKRDYSSPHDRPREGDDIYDVYSLSPDNGLNGVPYREW